MHLIDEVRASKKLPSPQMARLIRVNAGVSQERLARELGVHRVTVARWEAGRRSPRGPAKVLYADLLDELHRAVA